MMLEAVINWDVDFSVVGLDTARWLLMEAGGFREVFCPSSNMLADAFASCVEEQSHYVLSLLGHVISIPRRG